MLLDGAGVVADAVVLAGVLAAGEAAVAALGATSEFNILLVSDWGFATFLVFMVGVGSVS